MEKNNLFQFSSWKQQPHISWQALQMEGWAMGVRKDFRGFDLELTGTLRGGKNGVRPTLCLGSILKQARGFAQDLKQPHGTAKG